MNWQEERDATLCEARCVVVKVGSAVLSTGSELNLPVLDNLVNQLAVLSRQGRRVVLVSSGAVAAGRTALKKLPGEPAAVGLSGKQAAAAVGQGRLMHLYDNAFAERGILAAQVLLTRPQEPHAVPQYPQHVQRTAELGRHPCGQRKRYRVGQ